MYLLLTSCDEVIFTVFLYFLCSLVFKNFSSFSISFDIVSVVERTLNACSVQFILHLLTSLYNCKMISKSRRSITSLV